MSVTTLLHSHDEISSFTKVLTFGFQIPLRYASLYLILMQNVEHKKILLGNEINSSLFLNLKLNKIHQVVLVKKNFHQTSTW